jgi:hypothetical protein
MRSLIVAMLLLCFSITLPCAAADMNKPVSGWANVPGGTVWLNPGEAYEHDSGLVRDRQGVKRYPTTPQMRFPQQSPTVWPSRPVAPQPMVMPQPYAPNPYFAPAPAYPYAYPNPQPYYQPSPYDHGPYVDPNCPTCVNPQSRRPRVPSSTSWGLGESIDPMDVPKTGDAPLAT